MKHQRKRTKPKDIAYGLHLCFLDGLSYRSTAKALGRFVHRSHVSIWKWVQRHKPKKMPSKRKNINEFVVDETQIKVGSHHIWLRVAIEPKHRQIIQVDTSFVRNMLVAERFVSHLINKYGKHPTSTDGGTWHPQAKLLRAEHHIHPSCEKSVIERVMQHVKDRTEGFDDHFPCKRNKCDFKHVRQWLELFVDLHDGEVTS